MFSKLSNFLSKLINNSTKFYNKNLSLRESSSQKIDNKFKSKFLDNRPTHEVWGSKGGVTSMDPIATTVGINILNKGGNAIDASVAIASTLAVTSPNWSGLAGDSAWLYYNEKNKKTSHLDGYSVCPKKIDINYLRKYLKLKLE